jgi:hypothetical protein
MTSRPAIAAAAAASVFALLAAHPASAALAAPLVMGPIYVEPAPEKGAAPVAAATGCPITILELTDPRRAPETIGIAGRPIVLPADRQAWLRSVMEAGLAARGFTPRLAAPDAIPAPDALNVRISLKAIWISVPALNKSASVVFRAAAGQGEPGPAHDYRGDITNVNWWGSQSEFNDLLDRTTAQALDAMAADLRPLCVKPAAEQKTAAAD